MSDQAERLRKAQLKLDALHDKAICQKYACDVSPIVDAAWQRDCWRSKAISLEAERDAFQKRVQELERLINSPETKDFIRAIELEAAHQRERWGVNHDGGKADADWFWLIGYLAGKALRPDNAPNKILHHIITTAAVCLNWHRAKTGFDKAMRPGIDGETALKGEGR